VSDAEDDENADGVADIEQDGDGDGRADAIGARPGVVAGERAPVEPRFDVDSDRSSAPIAFMPDRDGRIGSPVPASL
jgi:hypothetical protein